MVVMWGTPRPMNKGFVYIGRCPNSWKLKVEMMQLGSFCQTNILIITLLTFGKSFSAAGIFSYYLFPGIIYTSDI